jgi:CMP-N-acetylneuraminic acid synthetase/quercetin dioxygenase-like cupin family protein
MKVVGMIPARLGSTRVKNKNLRLLGDKPLVNYIIDSASGSSNLDDLYLNSEGLVFKELAEDSGIKFYHRPESLATNSATNDDFVLDFINQIDCDIIIQLLPTSPFVSSEEIDKFIETMVNGNFDTLVSVYDVQIESIFNNQPINFDQKKQTPPSQLLSPIQAYACGLMGWNCNSFRKNMELYSAAYHGGDGKVGFFTLAGNATVDIDREEDFILAEAVLSAIGKSTKAPKYYTPNDTSLISDADVKRILSGDGVVMNNQDEANQEKVNLSKIIDLNGRNSSWSHTVINSPSNSATLIAQMPGQGNRKHYHPDWDEWWFIIEGKWIWDIEGEEKIIQKGEVVFIERNRKHQITAYGDQMAIRLAVSRYDVAHIYDEDQY